MVTTVLPVAAVQPPLDVAAVPTPLVTVAVPSFNQGAFLDKALRSIFSQGLPIEAFVLDGGSSDGSLAVIRQWEKHLAGWRSHPDRGQAAAINEGIARGRAPFVAWLNSDDFYRDNGLVKLVKALIAHPDWAMAYGRAQNADAGGQWRRPVWVEPFSERRLARRCIVAQPATLIRRSAWEAVGGLDETLQLAMDYDLWWRLHRQGGRLGFVDEIVAANRLHPGTKTQSQRRRHYREAMAVVRRHYGRLPAKWWLAWPYSVWFKSLLAPQRPAGAAQP